jgi:hypothetical protein
VDASETHRRAALVRVASAVRSAVVRRLRQPEMRPAAVQPRREARVCQPRVRLRAQRLRAPQPHLTVRFQQGVS